MARSPTFLLGAVLILLAPATSSSAETVRCTECGMKVDVESRFTSRIVQGEGALMFCDIGDLLTYLNRTPSSRAAAQVRDHRSGKWIGAEKAFYVRSEEAFRTPMGWSIAAFESREVAAASGTPMDLAGALGAVR
jgi:nitrous oxide reductase accessory protein NosL